MSKKGKIMIPGINTSLLFNDCYTFKTVSDIRLCVMIQILKSALDSWKNVRESFQKLARDSKQTQKIREEKVQSEKRIEKEIIRRKMELGLGFVNK
jgi:hypothetical protein